MYVAPDAALSVVEEASLSTVRAGKVLPVLEGGGAAARGLHRKCHILENPSGQRHEDLGAAARACTESATSVS
jgi:hypothetical protein